MQRRKGRCGVQLMQNIFVDQAMPPQLRSAMHDTVTDSDGSRGATIVEELSDTGNSVPLVGDGSRLGQLRMVAQILRVKLATLPPDRFCLAGQQQVSFRRTDTIETELERGRAAVQGQHNQLGGYMCWGRHPAQAAQRQSRTSGRSSPCSLMYSL